MMRNRISDFLNNIFFERFIIILIFLNLIIFIFQTDSTVNAALGDFFNYVEIFSITIFTVEYLLRCLTLNSFREIFGTYMLIDLAAILPFYLSFITVNTVFLRVLRLVRLLRIAKVARYSNALENIKKAFVKRKNELIITGIIFSIAVFLSATCIYYAEHNTNAEAFSSIPSAFWWAIVTFTTVGYGDAYPVTVTGKFVAAVTSIFGVGLHGLVIGVISTALMDVVNRIGDKK